MRLSLLTSCHFIRFKKPVFNCDLPIYDFNSVFAKRVYRRQNTNLAVILISVLFNFIGFKINRLP